MEQFVNKPEILGLDFVFTPKLHYIRPSFDSRSTVVRPSLLLENSTCSGSVSLRRNILKTKSATMKAADLCFWVECGLENDAFAIILRAKRDKKIATQ